MSILTVGPGEEYSTISAAVASSSSGDTIDVQAGTYTNDFLSITHSLTLQAVGGAVHLVATGDPPNGKGIIDEGGAGTNVTIRGFNVSGASVPDGNGAGIRYEGGNLVLRNDTVHNNQDGLLANPDPAGSITIAHSNFFGNGAGDGYTHNIYVGAIASLTVRNSTITRAVVGHDIKSRAASTTVVHNVIKDGPTGTASYEVDLPNGGTAIIRNNVIEKGPDAQNPTAISFGEEGGLYSNSSLTVDRNTILNDDTSHSTTMVTNATGITATIDGNHLFGWTTMASGPFSAAGNTILTTEPSVNGIAAGTGSPAMSDPSVPLSAIDQHLSQGGARIAFIGGSNAAVLLLAPHSVAEGGAQVVAGAAIAWETGSHSAINTLLGTADAQFGGLSAADLRATFANLNWHDIGQANGHHLFAADIGTQGEQLVVDPVYLAGARLSMHGVQANAEPGGTDLVAHALT